MLGGGETIDDSKQITTKPAKDPATNIRPPIPLSCVSSQSKGRKNGYAYGTVPLCDSNLHSAKPAFLSPCPQDSTTGCWRRGPPRRFPILPLLWLMHST